MDRQKAILQNMEVSSVDLCTRGANPESDIKLYKSAVLGGGETQMKEGFIKRLATAIAKTMGVVPSEEDMEEIVEQTTGEGQKKQINTMLLALEKSIFHILQSEEQNNSKIKLLQKTLEQFETELLNTSRQCLGVKEEPEEKQNQADDTNTDPTVKKAITELENTRAELLNLKKQFELSALEFEADKYRILGRQPKELAHKFYELKKAGGGAYEEYKSLLEEQAVMIEQSGLFKEIGSGHNGAVDGKEKLRKRVEAIRKENPSLTYAQAVVKACDEDPKLKEVCEMD